MGTAILNGILSELFDQNTIANEYVSMLDYNMVFNCESTIKEQVGVDISLVTTVVFGFAYYLLILKFVWKCFNTYLLGVDGDEDVSPMVLVINFVKAMAISLGFGLLFGYLLSIATEITSSIMNALKFPETDWIMVLMYPFASMEANLSLRLMFGVYVILSVILTVKFIKNAIELVILRMGISFSAVGILDSDGGVFKPYVKKFFQICFAVLIQVACFKLSMLSIMKGSVFWALAFISMAMTAPAFLQEFIMTNPGNGGKLQQALYSVSILRSFRKA